MVFNGKFTFSIYLLLNLILEIYASNQWCNRRIVLVVHCATGLCIWKNFSLPLIYKKLEFRKLLVTQISILNIVFFLLFLYQTLQISPINFQNTWESLLNIFRAIAITSTKLYYLLIAILCCNIITLYFRSHVINDMGYYIIFKRL